MLEFRLGLPTRPPIHHDNGFLDRYSSRAPTYKDYLKYSEWVAKYDAAVAVQGLPGLPHNDLPDALPAYYHFLHGNGADRWFDYERYIAFDRSGTITLQSALEDGVVVAERIYQTINSTPSFMKTITPGIMDPTTVIYNSTDITFEMTSNAVGAGGKDPRYPYPSTENWQKAIGAHFLWASAEVVVVPRGFSARFDMGLTIHVEDRYNFNPGNVDIATGTPDEANGIFEITGLARQYMNYATVSRRLQWDLGLYTGRDVIYDPPLYSGLIRATSD